MPLYVKIIISKSYTTKIMEVLKMDVQSYLFLGFVALNIAAMVVTVCNINKIEKRFNI